MSAGRRRVLPELATGARSTGNAGAPENSHAMGVRSSIGTRAMNMAAMTVLRAPDLCHYEEHSRRNKVVDT